MLHEYYYRYRQQRKLVKDIVDVGNYQAAKTKLETTIAEFDIKYPAVLNKRDFNYGEKLIMNHANRHLDTVIDKNDPPFVESTTGEIQNQSDIVKEVLLQTPKKDYSSSPPPAR